MDRGNVRVIQRREQAGFPLEARPATRIVRDGGREHLHGDVATQFRVPGPIHFTHAAGAEKGKQAVRPDPPACECAWRIRQHGSRDGADGPVEKRLSGLGMRQERLNRTPQRLIVAARGRHEDDRND